MKFAFNKDKNKSYLEYFLDKTVEGKIVKETESGNIIKNKSTIYIQDDPSLTNLDWYTATKTGNLAQAIRGRKVVKLLESNIDKMKPEILHVPGEITKNKSRELKDSELQSVLSRIDSLNFLPFPPGFGY